MPVTKIPEARKPMALAARMSSARNSVLSASEKGTGGKSSCSCEAVIFCNSIRGTKSLQDGIVAGCGFRQGAYGRAQGRPSLGFGGAALFLERQPDSGVVEFRHADFAYVLVALHAVERQVDVGKCGRVEVLVLGRLGELFGSLLKLVGVDFIARSF